MCQQLHKSLPMFIPMYWKITIEENYKISCWQDWWKILKVFQTKIKWQRDRYKSYKIYCQSIKYYKLFEEHFLIKLSPFFNMYILTWKRDIYFFVICCGKDQKFVGWKPWVLLGEFFFVKKFFSVYPLVHSCILTVFLLFFP